MPTIPPCFVGDLVVQTPWDNYKNRMYYSLTRDMTTENDVVAVSNKVMDTISDKLKVLMGDTCKIMRVEGRWYGPAGQDIEGVSSNDPVPGDITAFSPGGVLDVGDPAVGIGPSDVMPDDVVLMIQLRTGQAGRSKRGRRFFSGIHETIQNDGRILDAYRSACSNLAGALNVDVTGIALPDAGGAGTAHARHWDRKNNLLHPITKTYVWGCMMSRMDRRPDVLMYKF